MPPVRAETRRRSTSMRHFIEVLCQLSTCVCKRGVLAAGLSCCLCMACRLKKSRCPNRPSVAFSIDRKSGIPASSTTIRKNSKRPCVSYGIAYRRLNIRSEPSCNLFLMKPWSSIRMRSSRNERLGIFLFGSLQRRHQDYGSGRRRR